MHCNWQTLELIAGGGKYLVGLKNNQKQLLQQVIKQIAGQAVLYQAVETEKGHGRIEERHYEISDILEMETAARFKACQIRTAIKVRRETEYSAGLDQTKGHVMECKSFIHRFDSDRRLFSFQ